MSGRCRYLLVLTVSIGFGSVAVSTFQHDGRSGPDLRIVAPADGAFVTGATRLSARVEPTTAVSSVVFSVDGRETCTIVTPPFECDWDAGPLVSERNVRAVANLTGGGRVVRTVRTRGLAFTEKVDVDVVQVTVTVVDEDGHYVKGLPRSAFHVSEDGRPQTIAHFYSENVPLDLLVGVDVSGSMRPAITTLRRAVAGFLTAVPAHHRVTLMGFNDAVFWLSRHETNPAERMKAVERLNSWGSTVLYDAILESTNTLGSQPGRKALVVFTDGEDQASVATVDDVEEMLQASDLTLYMIGQGRSLSADDLRKIMERLARPTGGRALFFDRIDKVEDAFSELLEELSNQYVLAYEPTNTARDNTWREITVKVDGHPRVRARQGYRAR